MAGKVSGSRLRSIQKNAAAPPPAVRQRTEQFDAPHGKPTALRMPPKVGAVLSLEPFALPVERGRIDVEEQECAWVDLRFSPQNTRGALESNVRFMRWKNGAWDTDSLEFDLGATSG